MNLLILKLGRICERNVYKCCDCNPWCDNPDCQDSNFEFEGMQSNSFMHYVNRVIQSYSELKSHMYCERH
jgi:hypothetical protein